MMYGNVCMTGSCYEHPGQEFEALAGDRYQILFIMTTPPEARYSLIIPAYNEEYRITPLFDAIDNFNGELIVVCDGGDSNGRYRGSDRHARQDLTIRCLRLTTGWEKVEE